MKQLETITTEQITTAAHEAYEKLPGEHVAREGFGQISFLEGFAAGVKWREAEKECITASEQAKSLLVQWAKNMGYDTKSGDLADIINLLRPSPGLADVRSAFAWLWSASRMLGEVLKHVH